MALAGQLKADVEINPPADKFQEFFSCTPFESTKSSPDKIQSVDLIEGQWGKDGSVYCWNFLLDGKTANNKVKVRIDNKSKSTTLKTIQGTLKKSFKSFIINMKITPTTEQGSLDP
ncbi:MLP-like protein 31 [Pistacia vera]|uniref:MLP-like protein 31 n=1 Tax=Pistacia vera TaxID=55513 RepID=UPI001263BC13|nr:MLP-like protein 31 [Pistacia vera]